MSRLQNSQSDINGKMWELLDWFMHLPHVPNYRGTSEQRKDLEQQELSYRNNLCMLFGVECIGDIELDEHIKVTYTPKWILGHRAFKVGGFHFEYQNQGSTESVTYCGLTGIASFYCSNVGTITNESHLLEACKGFCDYLTEEFGLLTVCKK